MTKESTALYLDGQTYRKDRAARNSGIELLKVFAIVGIICCHVVSTLNNGTYMRLSSVATDWQQLAAVILYGLGMLGNTIFFTCSAWFLLDSARNNKRKIVQILADSWVISVIFLAVIMIHRGGQLGRVLILKQFLPTTFGNNWYVTCYFVFFLLYPFLNSILTRLNQRGLLRVCVFLLTLYIVFSYFLGGLFTGGGLFQYSALILWVTFYFVIAYLKYYLPDSMDSPFVNRMLLILGIGGHCIMVFLTNLLGLYTNYFSDKLMRWNVNYSPFYLMIAIALLNFARNARFRSKLVNHISGLSYLIYIIHENELLRNYYRPKLWEWVYETFGFKYLLLWILALTAVVFAFAFCCALLYEQTLQRLVDRFCGYAYPRIARIWGRIENILLKLH